MVLKSVIIDGETSTKFQCDPIYYNKSSMNSHQPCCWAYQKQNIHGLNNSHLFQQQKLIFYWLGAEFL